MFDIGFWEVLLIGAIALIVIGPDRLPGFATLIGRWVGRARRFTTQMRTQIQQELETEHLKNLVDEQKRELESLRQDVDDVRDEAETAGRNIDRSVRDLGAVARDDHSRDDDPDGAGQALAGADVTTGTAGEAGRGDAGAKKTAAKKRSAKKSAAKRASAKKSSSNKSVAKKKGTASKTSAKKAPGKKKTGSQLGPGSSVTAGTTSADTDAADQVAGGGSAQWGNDP